MTQMYRSKNREKGEADMWLEFIKHTFGLQNHPRVAFVVAWVVPVVVVGGIVALAFN